MRVAMIGAGRGRNVREDRRFFATEAKDAVAGADRPTRLLHPDFPHKPPLRAASHAVRANFKHPKDIKALTSLRFFAAVAVLLFHSGATALKQASAPAGAVFRWFEEPARRWLQKRFSGAACGAASTPPDKAGARLPRGQIR